MGFHGISRLRESSPKLNHIINICQSPAKKENVKKNQIIDGHYFSPIGLWTGYHHVWNFSSVQIFADRFFKAGSGTFLIEYANKSHTFGQTSFVLSKFRCQRPRCVSYGYMSVCVYHAMRLDHNETAGSCPTVNLKLIFPKTCYVQLAKVKCAKL